MTLSENVAPAVKSIATLFAPAIIAVGAAIAYVEYNKPHPQPTGISQAAHNYVTSLPKIYRDAADKVASGEVTTKEDLIKLTVVAPAKFGKSMDSAISRTTQDDKKTLDAEATAEVLREAASGFEKR